MSLNAINTPMGGGPELVYDKTGTIGNTVNINNQNISGIYSLLSEYSIALIYIEGTIDSTNTTPLNVFSGYVLVDTIYRAMNGQYGSLNIYLTNNGGSGSNTIGLQLDTGKLVVMTSGQSGGFWLKIYGIK